MRAIGIIPARYSSNRFPGKPLADILGKSMIKRVYEQCKKANLISEIIVATDDNRIFNHVTNFGGNAMITKKDHISGTDRCNEIIESLDTKYDVVINIQGDQPFINPQQIDQVVSLFGLPEITIGTLAKKIDSLDVLTDINNPKVIFNSNGIAKAFCREITKINREKTYYKHIGIYGYRTKTLSEICKLSPSENEKRERLEQLRWLDNNHQIKVGITTHESLSIDTQEDVKKIKAQMR